MRRTKNFKLILDVILTIAMLTLFSKNFFGIHYHEVAGLAVVLLILVHILINVKTIKGMCRNFKRVPMNIKMCLIVDVLLLFTFIWMGISGILISKTILTEISTTNVFVKLYHMSLGGWSVILLGIHIGLHLCRKERKKSFAIVFTVFALIGGIYGISNSSVMRWISMPFAITMSAPREENGEASHYGKGNGSEFHGENSESSNDTVNSNTTDKKHINSNGNGQNGMNQGNGFGKGDRNGLGRGNGFGKDGENALGKGHNQGQLNLIQKVNVLIQFFGIMFSCAMITYWIVILKKTSDKAKEINREIDKFLEEKE